jgi:hypothetical protein
MPYRGATTICPKWGLSRFDSRGVNRRAVTGASRSQLVQNGSLVGSGVSFGMTNGGTSSICAALCSLVGFPLCPHHGRFVLFRTIA